MIKLEKLFHSIQKYLAVTFIYSYKIDFVPTVSQAMFYVVEIK